MKLSRNEPCWCGSGQKFKRCHGKAKKPTQRLQILAGEKLEKMRASCRLAANILDEVSGRVEPGVTTEQINTWVHEMILAAGAYPSPLNYPKPPTNPNDPVIARGAYPKSVCTSINDVVCHGIPSPNAVLKNGDIINIDVTCYLDGFHGDTSRTVYVGEPSDEARAVTECSRKCLELGIATVRAGSRLMDIGKAIFDYADKKGYGVVRDYTGHGVGEIFHAEPQVCHFPNKASDMELIEGMVFTIEPMINVGTHQTILDNRDGWTVYTMDGKLSAQFEHTILVTADGHEILTLPDSAR